MINLRGRSACLVCKAAVRRVDFQLELLRLDAAWADLDATVLPNADAEIVAVDSVRTRAEDLLAFKIKDLCETPLPIAAALHGAARGSTGRQAQLFRTGLPKTQNRRTLQDLRYPYTEFA